MNHQRKNHQLLLSIENLEKRAMLTTVGGHVDIPSIQDADAHSNYVETQDGYLVVWGSDQSDTIKISSKKSEPNSATVQLNDEVLGKYDFTNGIVVFAKGGNDNVRLKRIYQSATIDGGDGNDVLRAGNGNDAVIGGNGNDQLFGGKGNDELWGDAGTDLLKGQGNDDLLYTSEGGDSYKGGGGRDQIIGTEQYAVERIRNVTYVTRGDLELEADVYVPDGEGPFPAIVAIHGGFFRIGSKSQISGRAEEIASHGFTVVAINYRLAPENLFPAHIEDAKAAVRWMRAEADTYKIDPDRIGSYGYSAGGNLALLLGTTDPSDGLEGPGIDSDSESSRVQVAVAGGAPVDFTRFDEDDDDFAYLLGGTRGEVPELYEQISPVYSLTPDDPPMLLFHGTRDNTVVQPTAMIEALEDTGVEHEFYEVTGKGHLSAARDDGAMEATIAFLKLHLA